MIAARPRSCLVSGDGMGVRARRAARQPLALTLTDPAPDGNTSHILNKKGKAPRGISGPLRGRA